MKIELELGLGMKTGWTSSGSVHIRVYGIGHWNEQRRNDVSVDLDSTIPVCALVHVHSKTATPLP